ncbi:SIR2 family protein [Megasphaera butyrica]|uniref:SIR2 family protein n=1 Tax=Megasphaera butyrica TaxID=2981791 RepID=UPI0008213BCE|nr:SIR2 family protein [Megasphaera butyrica]MCU6714923.1 SIR2 family protein [Megasphaera butyrica]SCH84019.1 Uncharacterised protein [uncultured Megasphaera sp.]SCJ42706.1 Uncharacterised protein [uncultured Ruminococcus sp.]
MINIVECLEKMVMGKDIKMENKASRITVLLGAGSSVEIGGITSYELTKKISEKLDTSEEYTKIYNILTYMYMNENEKLNFEDIFNILEHIYSINHENSKLSKIITLYEPWKNINPDLIKNLIFKIIAIIAACIHEYDEKFDINNENTKFFVNFWKEISQRRRLDITTLNYDTCVEQCLSKEAWTDGYNENEKEKIPEIKKFSLGEIRAQRFDPQILAVTEKSRIMHLHGCILFGTPSKKNDELGTDIHDMYKFNTYDDASDYLDSKNFSTQDWQSLFAGPIITGLRKVDKITIYPYSSYLYEFEKSILNNESLLIIGYSFGDLYLNYLLKRMLQLHGEKRRIVIITKYNEEKINNFINHFKRFGSILSDSDIAIVDELTKIITMIDNTESSDSLLSPEERKEIRSKLCNIFQYIKEKDSILSENENEVITKLMNESYMQVLEKNKNLFEDKVIDKIENKYVHIYYKGMRDAFENHEDEIINFLNGDQ